MSGSRTLKSGDVLFNEGDPSDSMYVVKTGRLGVYKSKGGKGDVELATITHGQMIGEMAFFDKKPRSATIKAQVDSEVIELPFSALTAQFQTFPEWLKSIVKTINDHLRDANKRIKNLEQQQGDSNPNAISQHLANKLAGILSLVATRYGKETEGGYDLNAWTLRNYTIQVFQAPTNKMNLLMSLLQGLGHMKVEDIGEGKQRITIYNRDIICGFSEWYNDYLYKAEDKKVTVHPDDVNILKALIHYGKKEAPDDQGQSKINLVEMQNESMKDLGFLASITDTMRLEESGFISEKFTKDEVTFCTGDIKELERVLPYWQIYYAIEGTNS